MSKPAEQPRGSLPSLDGYTITKKIGSGLTASVFEASSQKNGRVSIKIIDPGFYASSMGAQLINNQIAILKQLKHESVLRLVEVANPNGKMHIVTDFCEGGDLETLIRSKKKLGEKYALQLMKQMIDGCLYLSQHHIIHRDIKPSNVFLMNEKPIIADFGFAVREADTKLLNFNAGSPLYMPYESLTSKYFSEKSDVFAIGVTFYEMLTGNTPWTAKSQRQLAQKLKITPQMPAGVSQEVNKLILSCISVQAKDRPTFKDISRIVDGIMSGQKQALSEIKDNAQITSKSVKKVEAERTKKAVSFQAVTESRPKKENKENLPPINSTAQQAKLKSISVVNSSKKSNSRSKSNRRQPQVSFLSNLNPSEFTFLPSSLIYKFKCILSQYRKILGISSPAETGRPPCQVEENDKLLEEIKKCQTELQLCRVIEAFVRRLFRLTKNYKEYPRCLTGLEKLYTRVTTTVL